MASPFSLSGRTILVTGSSRGIGLACALALREAGARALFHGLTARPAEVPSDALYFEADLSSPDEVTRLAREALETHDADTLVHSAGGFFDVPFPDVTPGLWEKTFAVNVRSAYFLVQALAKRRAGRGGAAVLVSSTNGFQAESDSTAYDTSKGALVMMTRTLAVSLGREGIRVNGLAPGLIRTPLTARWIDTDTAKRHHYEAKIPLERIGTPEDCAPVCVFLCSDAARYLTGETVVVDGGLTCAQIGRMEGR